MFRRVRLYYGSSAIVGLLKLKILNLKRSLLIGTGAGGGTGVIIGRGGGYFIRAFARARCSVE